MKWALALVAVAACGGGGGPRAGGGGGTTPVGPTPVRVDAGTAAPAAAPLTVRECDQLIDRAVALAAAGRGSGSAAPTPAEIESVAASLREDLGVRCAALPRAAWTCAMAATTLVELAACEPVR